MKRRALYLVILAFSLSVYVNAHAPSSEITGLWVGGALHPVTKVIPALLSG